MGCGIPCGRSTILGVGSLCWATRSLPRVPLQKEGAARGSFLLSRKALLACAWLLARPCTVADFRRNGELLMGRQR
eukprot:16223740-Heterocapsa_arctica.AAC.1